MHALAVPSAGAEHVVGALLLDDDRVVDGADVALEREHGLRGAGARAGPHDAGHQHGDGGESQDQSSGAHEIGRGKATPRRRSCGLSAP